MLPLILRNKGVPWYLMGGIPRANCVGAYRAKGAASYAASKVNLVKPGTNNLADGAAYPTWAAATGWTFLAASTQYLTIANAVAIAVPLSMICRFNADNIVTQESLMAIVDNDGDSYFTLYIDGAVVGDPITFYTHGAGWPRATSSAGYTAGSWYTAAGISAASNSRAAYINGGNKGTEATDNTPAGLDLTLIGTSKAGGVFGGFLNGKISACAFYNIALSDAQVLALHNAMAIL